MRCPNCRGTGEVPDLSLDEIKRLIARGAQRDFAVGFSRVFCGYCGGAYYAGKDCPYCALFTNGEDFSKEMAEHRAKNPDVYDDAWWLTKYSTFKDGQRQWAKK